MNDLPNTFHVTHVGSGPIELSGMNTVYEFRPIEFFIKEDGAKDDGPSFAIVGQTHFGAKCIMQISAKMFRVAYEEMKKIYER